MRSAIRMLLLGRRRADDGDGRDGRRDRAADRGRRARHDRRLRACAASPRGRLRARRRASVMKRITSSLRPSWRSSSTIAAEGASMLSRVKYALRFFLMRKARDLRPQASTLETEPPLAAIEGLELSRSALRPAARSRPDAPDRYARREPWRAFPSFARQVPTLSPSSPKKGSTRIVRRREHGKPGRWALPRRRNRSVAAFRSAPSGTLRIGALIAKRAASAARIFQRKRQAGAEKLITRSCGKS